MSVENDLYADLRAILRATWPEVTANGIFESDHVERLAWEKLTPPYAVIHIPDFPEADWSRDTLCYEPDVHIYYVAATSGPLDALRDKLDAARLALIAAEPTHTQITEVYGLSTSNPASADEVLSGKRMPHQAGRISCKCLIGS